MSARLTRKPGALFTGTGSRSIAAEEGARLSRARRPRPGRGCTTSTSCMRDTGLKKWMPTSARGRARPLRSCFERDARRVGGEDRVRPHLRLDRRIDLALQLERFRHRLDHQVGAAHALAREIGDQPVERVADLDALVADLAEQLGRALRSPWPSGSGFMSASVTVKPCQAHQAAMSPPIAPAPITCTRVPVHSPSASALSFSRRKNTRTRLRDGVGDHAAGRTTRSRPSASRRVAAVRLPEVDQRVRRRIVLERRLLGGLARMRLASELAAGRAVDEP